MKTGGKKWGIEEKRENMMTDKGCTKKAKNFLKGKNEKKFIENGERVRTTPCTCYRFFR